MKSAKKEQEGLKPLQGESGYLAANAVILPESRLNSRDQASEPLPGNGLKSLQTLTDFYRQQTITDNAAAEFGFEKEEETQPEPKTAEPIKNDAR